MKISLFAMALALASGSTVLAQAAAPAVQATAESAATLGSGADGAVVVGDRIYAGAESGGIEVYDMTGKRLASHAVGNIRALDARKQADGTTLIAALDGSSNAANLLRLDPAGVPQPVALEGPTPAMTLTGLCLARDYRDDALYLFLLGEGGEIEQWSLVSTSTGTKARLARRMALGSETGYCAADDRGSVFVSQEAVGVWRLAINPDAELKPEIVDIVRLGNITDEAKGVAISPDRRLVVSDASANRLNLYDLDDGYKYLGSVPMRFAADAVEDPGSVTVAGGMIVVADDDNAPERPNFKITTWPAVLAAAGLAARPEPAAPKRMPIALPTVETTPVETGGDAADDPAIWIDPADPSRSVIIGTQKQSGLYVYDLSGKVLQFLPDGRMNNVDLRTGFRLGGKTVTLVTASNRTTKGISIYTLDPGTRLLTSVADGLQTTGLDDPYGLCMYRSARSRKTFVFVNQTDGKMRQWELIATPAGTVRIKLVRDMPFASQVEGCVADDEMATLYVGEEDVGIWRQGAEPRGGAPRSAVAKVEGHPALKDDVEGMGLYKTGAKTGYLVVSSQGNDSYAVFRREGANEYVGSFTVGADPASGIDGVSETDGLEVTSMSAGPGFARGLMVAQDGRNVSPPEPQNFKLVPWEAIAKALSLPTK